MGVGGRSEANHEVAGGRSEANRQVAGGHPATGGEPQVVVAVVSWNTRELLRDCLRSLEPEAASGLAQVWVCDNASEDGSAEMVATSFPWVHLIASERNLGFGAAVNTVAHHTAGAGATATSGPTAHAAAAAPAWIAPANADVRLTPGALRALLTAGAADPHAGVIAPQLILPDNSIQHSVHPFPGLAATAVVNLGLGGLIPGLARRLTLDGRWDQGISRTVDWAHGAFLLIRRDAFDGVAGFDPDQFLYAEDLDIAWRLAREGWHTRYEPSAEDRHAHSAAITQLYGDDRDFFAQRSAYAWMLRRQGVIPMRLCAAGNTLGAAVRAAAATLRSAAHGNADGFGAWQLRRHTRLHLNGLLASRRSLQKHH